MFHEMVPTLPQIRINCNEQPTFFMNTPGKQSMKHLMIPIVQIAVNLPFFSNLDSSMLGTGEQNCTFYADVLFRFGYEEDCF